MQNLYSDTLNIIDFIIKGMTYFTRSINNMCREVTRNLPKGKLLSQSCSSEKIKTQYRLVLLVRELISKNLGILMHLDTYTILSCVSGFVLNLVHSVETCYDIYIYHEMTQISYCDIISKPCSPAVSLFGFPSCLSISTPGPFSPTRICTVF